MGQYHKVINLDKQEVVDPHGLGLGSKQYEHNGCEASLADAIYLLVMSSPNRGGGDWSFDSATSGRWCGDRVVVLGDYTTDEDIEGVENADELWGKSKDWEDITHLVRNAFTKIYPITYKETTPSWDANHKYWSREAVE